MQSNCQGCQFLFFHQTKVVLALFWVKLSLACGMMTMAEGLTLGRLPKRVACKDAGVKNEQVSSGLLLQEGR